MEFSEFLACIPRLNLAPHGRTGLKYPYKLLLLASVVDLIGEGELPTPEVVLDDTLEGVFRGYLESVFPGWPHKARAGQPFWHLASDTGLFTRVASPDYAATEQVLLGADWHGGVHSIRAMRLPDAVHRRLCSDPHARTLTMAVLDEQLRSRCGAIRPLLPMSPRKEVVEPTTSMTEKVLEDRLVGQWRQSAFGRLDVHLSRAGSVLRPGRQIATSAGRIDILGWQPLDCTWWVVELKKGRSDDRVIGQVQRYMARIREMTGEPVRGAVVVQEVAPWLRLAAEEARLSLWKLDLTHEHIVLRDVGRAA